ncbi:MAG: hypothetical protein GYB35_13435 [Algicola sp.]|nr:hypothetical protein [Algicola sp.]
MKTQDKRLTGIIIFVSLLLFVPLIAMQFTKDVSWTLNDFLIAGVLLYGTGFIVELIIRKVKSKHNRLLLSLLVLVVLFLIWLEIAVGIFGTPFAGS